MTIWLWLNVIEPYFKNKTISDTQQMAATVRYFYLKLIQDSHMEGGAISSSVSNSELVLFLSGE